MTRPLPTQKQRASRRPLQSPWLTELDLHTTITDLKDLQQRNQICEPFETRNCDREATS